MTTDNFAALDQLDAAARAFAARAPAADYWSLRLVATEDETLAVRDDVAEPATLALSRGALLTVVSGAGVGYGATSDLSPGGLAEAFRRAAHWAEAHARLGLFDAAIHPRSALNAQYASEVAHPWASATLDDKLAALFAACRDMDRDERIIERVAWLAHRRSTQLLVTSDGGRIIHDWTYVRPGLAATAFARVRGQPQTQTRRGGGAERPQQGGLERLDAVRLTEEATRVADEAIALLDAPECPSGRMDLVLAPNQMVLQIHESIGHPLELDRILGDERNYAGGSFVTLDMLGRYQYGSELLDITFDPTVPGELASAVADDDGTPAERIHLIRNGLLERPLGGALSRARAGIKGPGTANARASGWDRPPIDRMANLNLEPRAGGLADLIRRVERGVLMDTNRSWSIDDSRNKFQFGCELGRLITDGELKGLVRNPGYRGVSARFWRSLDGVGGPETVEVRGVSNCGKGEPNQGVYVGHAAPPCLFRDVDCFGGGL